ncbi:hypothetical protein HAX54_027725 [Datura stramonium]|uniref:Uncharacterized protein n=1 Tax=Datura stramonium TaxID=4076 RepID=A0ABS8V505_DATST|nr:hypothetical protein [Datura stramonium]
MLLILSVRLLGPRDPGNVLGQPEPSSQSVQVTKHTFLGGQACKSSNTHLLGAKGFPFPNQAIKHTFLGAQGSSPHSQLGICT